LGFIVLATASLVAQGQESRTYEVGRKVSSFPQREDLSTPESAYASIHRAVAAEGFAAFDRLSVARIVAMSRGVRPPAFPEGYGATLLGADVLEVHLWDRSHAVVVARLPLRGPGKPFDVRSLERVGGRWLNAGNDRVDTLEQARKDVDRLRKFDQSHRPR
jgi:hypothetical protein